MKRSEMQLPCRVAVLALGALVLGPPAFVGAQSTSDSDQIKQKVFEYARSIDAADAASAAQVWLDSPDVSFIHPLGHEHGFKQIQRNIYQNLMGETFSHRKLSPRDISVHLFRDCAWVEFDWDFNAKYKKDGSPINTHGRETQVYWRTEQGWRLVHVHYSGMPATDQRTGF
jgi:ketosteroid isomerase-like protein